MIKKIFLFALLAGVLSMNSSAQVSDPEVKKLFPVDSLLSRIKQDTALAIPDSMKVDTVYIDNPLNVFKVGGDLASAYGFASISYERVIHFMGSIQLKVEFLGKYNPFESYGYVKKAYANTTNISGIGLVPEIRYYGSEKYAPVGLFAGLYVPMKFASVEVPAQLYQNGQKYTIDKTQLSYTQVGLGADVGYQYLYKKRLTLEGLLGISISKGSFSGGEYQSVEYFGDYAIVTVLPIEDGSIGNAYYPRVELNIGWAF